MTMTHTLLLRLAGPMQSWGVQSRFDERDTGLEPSKSGVIGLLCAALGIDRAEAEPVLELAQLRMGVRVDREGVLRSDYHTAQDVIRADGKGIQDTAVSRRAYLADALFIVGLEGEERALLERIQAALKNPRWPLSLGRKSFVPSRPVWLEDAEALVDGSLEAALKGYAKPPLERFPIRLMLEADIGSLRMDQPLSSFSERRFGSRFVRSELWECEDVPV